jgi:hypothetical protein
MNLAGIALLLILSAFTASQARAAMVSIEGGVASALPARNDVVHAAGVTMGGGSVWINGTLTLAGTARLQWQDLGSESAYVNLVRLGNLAGPALVDVDDFGAGAGGVHSPWGEAGSVTQSAGIVDLRFSRSVTHGTRLLIANGITTGRGSPSLAQIAFAYLDDANQIVAHATSRVLVLLDDRGARRRDPDFDDYVGVLTVMTPVPLPAAWLLFGSALLAFGAAGRRRLDA